MTSTETSDLAALATRKFDDELNFLLSVRSHDGQWLTSCTLTPILKLFTMSYRLYVLHEIIIRKDAEIF